MVLKGGPGTGSKPPVPPPRPLIEEPSGARLLGRGGRPGNRRGFLNILLLTAERKKENKIEMQSLSMAAKVTICNQ